MQANRSAAGARRAATIVLIVAATAGCAATGYSTGAARRHLESAGLTAAQASCVAGRMGPEFGDSRLGARAEPSAAERAAERALMRECGVSLQKLAAQKSR